MTHVNARFQNTDTLDLDSIALVMKNPNLYLYEVCRREVPRGTSIMFFKRSLVINYLKLSTIPVVEKFKIFAVDTIVRICIVI